MRLLVLLLTALVFALASCGDDDDGGSDSGGGDSGAAVSDEDKIEEAIATFAENGSDVCDVLTDEYIEQLFGTRDKCDEVATDGSESSDVDVENVEIDGDTATAEGTADGDTATLTLEKDGDDWKISSIEGAGD